MLNFKRLCFAAAAVTIGSSAFAQITGPLEGPSDVFLAVWNPTTNQSIVQDLGISETDFEAAAGANHAYQIDGTVAAFQSALSTTSSTAGVLWEVVAGNAVGAVIVGNNFNGNTLAYTTTVAGGQAANLNAGALATASANVGSYVDNFMVGPNTSTVTAAGATNAAYWAKGIPAPNPGATLGVSGLDFSGALGSSLNYYTALSNDPSDSSGEPSQIATLAGMWSLDNSTGKLNWTASGTGQTPLPAAVWMFLSGLLGLGTVSRRKSA